MSIFHLKRPFHKCNDQKKSHNFAFWDEYGTSTWDRASSLAELSGLIMNKGWFDKFGRANLCGQLQSTSYALPQLVSIHPQWCQWTPKCFRALSSRTENQGPGTSSKFLVKWGKATDKCAFLCTTQILHVVLLNFTALFKRNLVGCCWELAGLVPVV